MDATRFDSLTRSFASTTSRRRLLQGMAGGIVAGLIGKSSGASAQPQDCPLGLQHCGELCFDWMSDERHCGGCDRPCGFDQNCFQGTCTPAVCTVGPIVCWGDSVDPRTDSRNCGQCGELCAPGKGCFECACQEPDLRGGACRSEQLRLWANAFLPGFIEGGFTSTVSVDGIKRTIFQMETDTGEDFVLLADRDPDRRFPDTPFSSDIDAPAMAQFELGITLPSMGTLAPEIRGGRIVQLRETGDDTYVTLCDRQLKPPLSTCVRRVENSGTPEPAGALATFDVNCSWTLERDSSGDPGCPLYAHMFPPVRIQGTLTIARIDANGIVEIRFTGRDEPAENVRVSPFPAFEMYARLDDGNQVAMFQRDADRAWTADPLVEVKDEIGQQCEGEDCQGVVARLGCGCGAGCVNGQYCVVSGTTQECNWLDAYYVLTGGAEFQPTNDGLCADPRCPADSACSDPCREGYFEADGPVTVTVDGRTVYTSDPFGRQILPPIGFRARPGAKVGVFGPFTNRNRSTLRYLTVQRVDGPYGMLVSQNRPDLDNKVVGSADGQTGIEIKLGQDRSDRGSTICCRDQGQQVCVDRMLSIDHCGGCNQSCTSGRICLTGRCICPHPWIWDGTNCVDPTQDSRHCGPDLKDCTLEGKFCAQSSCVSADCRDTARFQVCDGQCVPLDDEKHCGFSCETCRVPQNGRALCVSGSCDFECFDEFQRCGFECVDPSQPEHCGTQCLECPGKLNAGPSCTLVEGDFQCGFKCNDGFHDCNGDCFWNLANETCGFRCEPCPWDAPTCVEGECCWDNATLCPGGCTDLWNDPNNCGGCGTICNPGFCCGGGACVSEATSCGGCGIFCESGQFCIEGQCQNAGPDPPTECPPCTVPDGNGGCIPIMCEN